MLAEAADFVPDMNQSDSPTWYRTLGCYVLEVGRREFGGRYSWFEQREAPVRLSGTGLSGRATSWDQVRGRLLATVAATSPSFYADSRSAPRRAEPGTDALYV